jgi:hypothetical protein
VSARGRREASQPWVAASLAVVMLGQVACGGHWTTRPRLYASSGEGDFVPLAHGSGGAVTPRPPQDVLGPYLSWIRAREAELKRSGLPEPERRVRELTLRCFALRVYAPDEKPLRATTPERLDEACWLEAKKQQRLEAERAAAREAKLDEYWRWALRLALETPRASPTRWSRGGRSCTAPS